MSDADERAERGGFRPWMIVPALGAAALSGVVAAHATGRVKGGA